MFELAEALMAEYHWTWHEISRQPLARQMALWLAMRIRKGGQLAGNDYRREEFIEYLNGEGKGNGK